MGKLPRDALVRTLAEINLLCVIGFVHSNKERNLLYYFLRFKYGKILYDTDSGVEVWKYIIGKIGTLIAIGAGLYHVQENPVGMSIFLVPVLLLLVFFRYEMIIVFKDQFIYISGFSSPLRPFKMFHYKDLKAVISPVNYEVNKNSKNERLLNLSDPRKKVHVLFKNGTDELFSTTINWVYLQQAANKINKELEKT